MPTITKPRRKSKSGIKNPDEPKVFRLGKESYVVPNEPAKAIRFFNGFFPVGIMPGSLSYRNIEAIQFNMMDLFGMEFSSDEVIDALGLLIRR